MSSRRRIRGPARRRRSLQLERLDTRVLLASDLQNVYQPLDVTDDLQVTALDALRVINDLSVIGDSDDSRGFVDVDGSGDVTSLDALLVINSLSDVNPISVMRLVHDTARGGTTNRDGVTSDLTLEGLVNRPHTPNGHSSVYLTSTSERGNVTSRSINDFLDGDRFGLTSSYLSGAFGHLADFQTGELTFTLRLGTGGPDMTLAPLGDIAVRFDSTAPQIALPHWVAADSESVSIYVLDDLPLQASRRDSGGADEIRFVIDDQDVSLQTAVVQKAVTIELAIGQLIDSIDPFLAISADAAFEDLAGNRAEVPGRFVLQPGLPAAPLDFVVDGPLTGSSFFSSGISANPGQLIRLPVAPVPDMQNVFVPVADSVRDFQTGEIAISLDEMSLSPNFVDSIRGEALYRLPNGIVSGDIVDQFGRVLSELHVVPIDQKGIDVVDGNWEIRQDPGGIDPHDLSYRHRFVADAQTVPDVDEATVADWPAITHGQVAPKFGFQQIQLAGNGGVSAPFDLDFAHPNLGALKSVVADPAGLHIWVGLAQRLVKLEPATADIVLEVDFSVDPEGLVAGIFADEPFTLENLQVIPAGVLDPIIEYIGAAPQTVSGDWLVAFANGPDIFVVVDPVNGQLLGTLPYQPLSLTDHLQDDTAKLPAVYHPQLQSWFTVTADGRRWQEYSLETGELERQAWAIGLSEHSDGDSTRAAHLFWDHIQQRMVLMTARQRYAFDVASQAFLQVDGYPVSKSFFIPDGLDYDRLTQVSMDAQGRFLVSNNSGALVRKPASEAEDPLRIPVVDQLLSVAQIGEPTDPTLPSANHGQLIEIRGENLDVDSFALEFDTRQLADGRASIYDFARTIAPFHFAGDGSRAWVTVPSHAIGTTIRIADAASQSPLPMQIVPFVDSILFARIGADDYELSYDGQPVNQCVHSGASDACGIALSNERLPLVRETIEVVTDGGTTSFRIGELTEPASVQIGELVSFAPRYGADFDFELPSGSVVPASSKIVITLASKNGGAFESLPERVVVDFVTETANGVLRYQAATALLIEGTTNYLVWLPIDFSGGTLEVRGAASGDTRLSLDVSPTVIGASGDSSIPGSSLLIAGVNLVASQITIDGISASTTDLSGWDKTALDMLRLEVPSGVSDGVVRIDNGLSANVIDQLTPWWDVDEMPVAEVGTPTFPDLPSVNGDQKFAFRVPADAETLRVRYLGLQLRDCSLNSAIDTRPWNDDEDLAEISALQYASPWIFREVKSSLWNILPLVPRTYSVEVGEGSGAPWIAFEFDETQIAPDAAIEWSTLR